MRSWNAASQADQQARCEGHLLDGGPAGADNPLGRRAQAGVAVLAGVVVWGAAGGRGQRRGVHAAGRSAGTGPVGVQFSSIQIR